MFFCWIHVTRSLVICVVLFFFDIVVYVDLWILITLWYIQTLLRHMILFDRLSPRRRKTMDMYVVIPMIF